MALPKPSTPIYELTIPSKGTKVKYRPFLVKDEKALLLAAQSESPKVMIDTLKEIISNCILTKTDIDTLALFDIEYVFCKLRAKSVGEFVEVNLNCEECNKKSISNINISDIEIERNPEHKNKFILFDNVGICLKYPDWDLLEKLKTTDLSLENMDSVFSVITDCIDYIYDDEEIYHAKESKKEDLVDFINNLTKAQLEQIMKFFETMPRLKKDLSYTCPHCKHVNSIMLEGLNNFF